MAEKNKRELEALKAAYFALVDVRACISAYSDPLIGVRSEDLSGEVLGVIRMLNISVKEALNFVKEQEKSFKRRMENLEKN